MVALELKELYGVDVVLMAVLKGGWLPDTSRADVPVLLGPTTVQPNSFEHLRARPDNPKILHEAGVFFALRSGYNHKSRALPAMTALAVAHGLPWKAAIEALCRNAYDILRLKRLPMLLREGYQADADVILCSGDPLLQALNRCWISGREADLRSKHTDLYSNMIVENVILLNHLSTEDKDNNEFITPQQELRYKQEAWNSLLERCLRIQGS